MDEQDDVTNIGFAVVTITTAVAQNMLILTACSLLLASGDHERIAVARDVLLGRLRVALAEAEAVVAQGRGQIAEVRTATDHITAGLPQSEIDEVEAIFASETETLGSVIGQLEAAIAAVRTLMAPELSEVPS